MSEYVSQPSRQSSTPSATVRWALNLEPSPHAGIHFFVTRNEERVSSVSFLLPPQLKILLQSQRASASPERDLTHFLDTFRDPLEICVHTERGALSVYWDSSLELAARTELECAAKTIRVRRVAVVSGKKDHWVRDLVRVGDGLLVDIESGRMGRLADAAGWYVAGLLVDRKSESGPDGEIEVEYESGSDPGSEDERTIRLDEPAGAGSASSGAGGFEVVSNPEEITISVFNEKKIAYPKELRERYLRDLALRKDGQPQEASAAALELRVVLTPMSSPEKIRLEAASFWNQQPFNFGASFYSFFEYLHHHPDPRLRAKKTRETLREAAGRMLAAAAAQGTAARPEDAARSALTEARLEASSMEAAREYLERFYKTFVAHRTENLLAAEAGFFLVETDWIRFGRLLLAVEERLGGAFLEWLRDEKKEVLLEDLYRELKALLEALETAGAELYYNRRLVRRAKLQARIPVLGSNPGWFEVQPEIRMDEGVLSEEEWRWILKRQGILEKDGQLLVVDDASWKMLSEIHDLFMLRSGPKKTDLIARIPRLEILDWVWLRQYGASVELAEEADRLVSRLLKFKRIESNRVPDHFKGSLRDYQKEGYDWLAFLYAYRLGGCLADDMGLGKTVQAIAFLGGLKEGKIPSHPEAKGEPHLVVVPPTLIFNWQKEFERFYPDLKVAEYAGSGRSIRRIENAEVILASYDAVRQDAAILGKKRFHVMLLDEAQYLKNIRAQRTAAIRSLRSRFTVTLTGTPLENHLGEYFSVLDLSLPGVLGDYQAFSRRAAECREADAYAGRLTRRARPFVMRRTKETILKELPPKQESSVYLDMTAKQKALYARVLREVRRDVDEAFRERRAAQAGFTALTALLRLRQICVSPRLLDPSIEETSPKIEYLSQKLRELVEEEHSALVFSQFTSCLDLIEEELRARSVEYFRMDGSVPVAKRKAMVDRFQSGAGAPIFLVSLKTGGVGLNLTRATYVFHADPWWNPAVETQASDRAHRIGQTRPVLVTRLLMRGGIEDRMVRLKKDKQKLYEQVLGEGRRIAGVGDLKREDFEFLLSTSKD